ncbi:hypothetical protein DFH29DRAFT_320161 [Suillus ampliporus]|nr:hypothetical protein DFH29DRAFT_320161 [Suillus ampliporus]
MSTADNCGRHTMRIGKSQKKISQQIYRSTEAEDFSQLRQIIQEITQESPHTRHDILVKAAEIMRQLDRDCRSLLTERAALTCIDTTESSMHYPVFYPAGKLVLLYLGGLADDRPVSQIPVESWLVNHGHQTMPMHPHPHSMYGGQNMDDATHNYLYFTYQ